MLYINSVWGNVFYNYNQVSCTSHRDEKDKVCQSHVLHHLTQVHRICIFVPYQPKDFHYSKYDHIDDSRNLQMNVSCLDMEFLMKLSTHVIM